MIRGLARHLKEPSLAEMRTPVTLVKVRNTPDTGEGFLMTLTRKYSSWSKMIAASGSSWGGGSEDDQAELTHVFVIRRHPELEEPEKNWVIIHNERMYRVIETQELGQRAFFWVVATNDEGPLAKYKYDDDATEENPHDPETPEDEPAPVVTDFPFWQA